MIIGNVDCSVPLREPAFHGACVEPPHSCGVSTCALFPLESDSLRCTSLCGMEEGYGVHVSAGMSSYHSLKLLLKFHPQVSPIN